MRPTLPFSSLPDHPYSLTPQLDFKLFRPNHTYFFGVYNA